MTTLKTYTGKWTSEVPKVEGRYIFYGKLWGDERAIKEGDKHYFVTVLSSALIFCEGHFWSDYKPTGVFTEAFDLPTPLKLYGILDTFHPDLYQSQEVRSDDICFNGDDELFFQWCRQHGADNKWYEIN